MSSDLIERENLSNEIGKKGGNTENREINTLWKKGIMESVDSRRKLINSFAKNAI
jgi:hypothetical protein